jgi:hypothetical protein
MEIPDIGTPIRQVIGAAAMHVPDSLSPVRKALVTVAMHEKMIGYILLGVGLYLVYRGTRPASQTAEGK